MINQARDEYENQIQQQLEQAFTDEYSSLIINLFIQYLPDNQKPIRQNTPYRLTQLRVNQELMKVKVIRENIKDFKYLKNLYEQFLPLYKSLDLSPSFIEELALQVLRSRAAQVKRWNNRNLFLLCFIQ